MNNEKDMRNDERMFKIEQKLKNTVTKVDFDKTLEEKASQNQIQENSDMIAEL